MTKVTHLTLDEGGGLSHRRIHLREISGEADAPLETVGQDLRAARQRRGDELATVSRALKIRKDHLEALEEDRIAALPGRAYAIGFVRSYADYLGLDSLQCVERFKREIAGRDDSAAAAGFPDDHDETRLPHGWAIIAVVVLGLIAYGAYHLARSADSLNQPVASVPTRIAARPTPPPIRHTPPAEAQQSTAPSPQSGAPPSSAPAPANQAALTPLSQEPQAAVPGETPHGQVYGQQNHNARVVLRARQPTRILVQGPGGTIFINRTLQPGDSYQVPDLVGLSLTVQRGDAVEIDLDGQAMGNAGRGPEVKEMLSLDPQAIVDRYSSGHRG
jgi:cytoskeleton protein RodZ